MTVLPGPVYRTYDIPTADPRQQKTPNLSFTANRLRGAQRMFTSTLCSRRPAKQDTWVVNEVGPGCVTQTVVCCNSRKFKKGVSVEGEYIWQEHIWLQDPVYYNKNVVNPQNLRVDKLETAKPWTWDSDKLQNAYC